MTAADGAADGVAPAGGRCGGMTAFVVRRAMGVRAPRAEGRAEWRSAQLGRGDAMRGGGGKSPVRQSKSNCSRRPNRRARQAIIRACTGDRSQARVSTAWEAVRMGA